MNVDLLWYLLVPAFLTGITIFILHKFVDSITWLQALGASAIGLAISAVIISSAFYIGKSSKTSDDEIYNGQITSKSRVHGSYIRSYSCRCYTYTTGSGKNAQTHEHCDTCYEDHYTVTWTAFSNIGSFQIDHDDWTSSSVYALPNPSRYNIIQNGDPVAVEHSYTNYIKAVPESLFRPASKTLKEQFAGKIPAYPIQIYDFYKVDRIIPVGINIPDLKRWNAELSETLKTLGPAKQANAVIVLANTNNPDYFYALQDAWLNGKKNDIVLVIGASHFPGKADWVRVMALTQDEIFQIKLRDDILALDSLTSDNIIDAVAKETMSTFKRKRMHDFEYLNAEIDPPAWVMWICMIFVTLAYGGFWFYVFRNNDAGSYGRFGHPRFRSY